MFGDCYRCSIKLNLKLFHFVKQIKTFRRSVLQKEKICSIASTTHCLLHTKFTCKEHILPSDYCIYFIDLIMDSGDIYSGETHKSVKKKKCKFTIYKKYSNIFRTLLKAYLRMNFINNIGRTFVLDLPAG